MNTKIYLFIAFLFVLYGCVFNKTEADLIDPNPNPNLKYEDTNSLRNYIKNSILYFAVHQGKDTADKNNLFAPHCNHNFKINVDNIFYSYDSLKCVAFIIIEDRDRYETPFNSFIIIGARNKLTDTWSFGEQNQYIGWLSTYQKAKYVLIRSYNIDIRKQSDQCGLPFKYGLSDPEFWEHNLYFTKVKDYSLFYFLCTYKLGGHCTLIPRKQIPLVIGVQ